MFGLPDDTLRLINDVFSIHSEIEKVLIYGSRAKGNYRNGSDIDLTLIGDSLTTALVDELIQQLDDLNTPYLMDISIYSQLQNPDLKLHIDRVACLFYKK